MTDARRASSRKADVSSKRREHVGLTPRRSPWLALFAVLLFTLANLDAVAQTPPPMRDDGAMHLVFLGQTRPVLLKLNVTIDGKPVAQHWNEYLQKWFAFLDGDDNGVLDAAEAARAPTVQAFMQITAQSAFFGAGFDPRAKPMPVNFKNPPGQGVTLREFQAFYTSNVVPVQFQGQSDTAAFYKQVSTTLFNVLDANKDGKLSKKEVDSAAVVLRKYDLEDTEWITAQNLAPSFADPLALRGALRIGPSTNPETKSDAFFHIRSGNTGLPALLLSRYDKSGAKKLDREQSGLDTATFRRLDTNGDRGLDAEELAHWHERPADFEITLPIGKVGGPPVQFQIRPQSPLYANALKPTPAGTMLELDDAHVTLSGVDGSMVLVRPPPLNQRSLQLFRALDTKKQGFITMKELQEDRQAMQLLGQLFTYADRDRDDKLTEKELEAFLALQAQGADVFATVSIGDQGRLFFQQIDVNKDNRLSLRELQNAWTRLSSFDANGDGFIEQSEMPRQFQISAQKGQGTIGLGQVLAFAGPRGAPIARPSGDGRYVPAWFSKMDKNGDGDVSRREFLGTAQDFARIDTDGDGLISLDEAIRFDPRPPQARRDR